MANDTLVTIVGNLVEDPSLRFISSGAAVVNFTIASTPRSFDKQSNEWKDGTTLFMRCSLWREAAENVAESLRKGMRVVVTGRLVSRSWDQDGTKRTVMEMQVDEVGPSLKYATAQVTRKEKSGNSSGGGNAPATAQAAPQGGSYDDPWASTPVSDEPWASAPVSDEPPF